MDPTMSSFGVIILVIFSVCLCEDQSGNKFSHDIDVQHPDSGERVKLKSTGQLSDTIDLDRTPGIKKVVCQDYKVLISVKEPGIGKDWKEGQILIGSSKWDCFRNTLNPNKRGVYAKIKSIYFPTDTGISVHTTEAGPFDVIEEANIEFTYSPGESSKHPPEVRLRYRRDLANVLKELLGEIDWEAYNTTRIPWNFNEDTDSVIGGITLLLSDDDQIIHYGNKEDIERSANKTFTCEKCYGWSDFEYTLQIMISKNEMNQPHIHKYTSELKANTSVFLNPKLTVNSTSMHVSAEVFRQPPTPWFSLPVAQVENKKLPPVNLAVSYGSISILNVSVESQGLSTLKRDIKINGSYTVSQTYTPELGMVGNVTVHEWSITSLTGNDETEVEKDLDIKSSLYQKMLFNTSIGWSEHDMEIKFSPPVEFRIVPTISATSKRTEEGQRCTTSDVSIEGEFNVTDAELIVNAFGTSIWDVMLSKGFHTSTNMTEQSLASLCVADCPRTDYEEETRTMEEVCGSVHGRIERNDTKFGRLTQFYGSSILFMSEEASDATWCGYQNRTCVDCVWNTIGEETNRKCADRMMTPELRTALSLMGSLVRAEWPDRKLLVLEAWDEPTSRYPHGQHGEHSLFYEGRAAQVTLTNPMLSDNRTVEPATDIKLYLSRLVQLAGCSELPFHKVNHKELLVEIAVKQPEIMKPPSRKRKKEHSQFKTEKEAFESALHDVESFLDVTKCPEKTGYTSLPNNHPWPIMTGNENDVVGGPTHQIHQSKQSEMKRLFEYPFGDVKFAPEGKLNDDCSGRKCSNCSAPNNDQTSLAFDWCRTRVMTPRMALRLRRLAILANQKTSPVKGLVVQQAYTATQKGQDSRLYQEGRALQLKHNLMDLSRLGALCICAGFDYVRQSLDNQYIEVFVKDQKGYRTTAVTYPSGEVMLAVTPPVHFQIPPSLADEPRIPPVIDGFKDSLQLSDYFQVGDFKYKKGNTARYLRIDPLLVGCLDQARQTYSKTNNGFVIKTGYKPLHDKTDPRRFSEYERSRFSSGQAVEVQPEQGGEENMMKLGKAFLHSCPQTLRMLQIGMSLGVGTTSFYVDIHPMPLGKNNSFVNVYIRKYYGKKDIPRNLNVSLDRAWKQMTQGGPDIFPHDAESACKTPGLGREKSYLTFALDTVGMCFTLGDQKFCKKTEAAREKAKDELWTEMEKSAGIGTLNGVKDNLHACFVTHCGGCPGSGSTWGSKVRECSRVVSEYLRLVPLLREGENVAFFNTGNRESAAHSMACSESNKMKCTENIQLYSQLQKVLATRYKPDPNTTIEEEVFGGADNPSPLLEIVEQELAMAASGKVAVYVENFRDISAVRNILKILMIYNNKIDNVTFHLMKGVKLKKLAKTLNRKLETWAGTSCPLWSRFSATPFSFATVSRKRTARSLKDSKNRNDAQHRMRNWEMEWLSQT